MRLKILVGALAVIGCLVLVQSGSWAQEDKSKGKVSPKKVEQGAASKQAQDVKEQPRGFDGSAPGKGGSTLDETPVPPVKADQPVKSRTPQEQMDEFKAKDKAQRQ